LVFVVSTTNDDDDWKLRIEKETDFSLLFYIKITHSPATMIKQATETTKRAIAEYIPTVKAKCSFGDSFLGGAATALAIVSFLRALFRASMMCFCFDFDY